MSQSQAMHTGVSLTSLLCKWAASLKGHASGIWLVDFDPSCLLNRSKDAWRKISAMHVTLEASVRSLTLRHRVATNWEKEYHSQINKHWKAITHHLLDIFRTERHFRPAVCYLSWSFFDLSKEKVYQRRQLAICTKTETAFEIQERLLKLLPCQRAVSSAFDILGRLWTWWIFLTAKIIQLLALNMETKLPSGNTSTLKYAFDLIFMHQRLVIRCRKCTEFSETQI